MKDDVEYLKEDGDHVEKEGHEHLEKKDGEDLGRKATRDERNAASMSNLPPLIGREIKRGLGSFRRLEAQCEQEHICTAERVEGGRVVVVRPRDWRRHLGTGICTERRTQRGEARE